MPPVGFEPTTPGGERPQTYALDRHSIILDRYAVFGRVITPLLQKTQQDDVTQDCLTRPGSYREYLFLFFLGGGRNSPQGSGPPHSRGF